MTSNAEYKAKSLADEAAYPESQTLYGGMRLRDYFAAAAISGGHARSQVPEYDLTNMFGPSRTGIRREEILAADAYRIADAMMKERAR